MSFYPPEIGRNLWGGIAPMLGLRLEHKKCVLAINRSCYFLVLVLDSPQTTRVLKVYNVYSTWVV